MSDAALPNPIPPLDASPEITTMTSVFQSWLAWQQNERDAEGLATDDHTHIITPPVWPTRGQLKAWIGLLRRLGEREARMREGAVAIRDWLARGGWPEDFSNWPDMMAATHARPATMSLAERIDALVRAALAAGKEGE